MMLVDLLSLTQRQRDAALERERELIGLLREAVRWVPDSVEADAWYFNARTTIAAFDAREKGETT